MLITNSGVFDLGDLEHCWEDSDFYFCWKGIVFIQGIPCGVESIKKFSEEIKRIGIQGSARVLKGHYFIVIKDKTKNVYYSFVDNSGLFHAFYSDSVISTSFLELVKFEGLSRSDLDREAIVEFIHFGNIYFRKTFFDSIKKISSKEILSFSDKGKICFLTKKIPDLEGKDNEISFFDFFEGLVSSIKNEKVSIDLTGGIDSRMLAVLLDYFGLEFEISVSGVDGIRDIEIAKEVASVLKRNLYIMYHAIENLEEDLLELFTVCDGLCNVLKHHGQLQSNKGRLGRGVGLKLSGLGGELYKDFWWLQDFPFYSKQKSNLERLFNLRIAPIEFKYSYLTDHYVEISRGLKQKVLQELSPYVLDINTKTYDNVYFNYRMQELAGRAISVDYSKLKSYAPLLELDLVTYGFNLSRKERFFNNFHRKIITSINPSVARVQTTGSGMSVSSKNIHIMQDVYRYIIDKSIRLTKKVGQKILKKTYFQESPIHPYFYSKVKGFQITRNSIELLKDEGIINKKLNISDVDNTYIGNFISLALLIEHLNDKRIMWGLYANSIEQ